MGRCSTSTLYVAGCQIHVGDVLAAWFDGAPVNPVSLPFLERAGTLELETRFGRCSAEVNPARLHGRTARGGTPDARNGVLAALALANLAGHPRRGESLAWSSQVARASLRHISDEHLAMLLDTNGPEVTSMLVNLAPGQVAVRSWRNTTVAARFTVTPGAPTLVAAAVHPDRVGVSFDPSNETVQFEKALVNGEQPPAKGWAQKASLAASHRDAALTLADDTHPLVRAAAYRHLRLGELAKRLSSEQDPTARRAAAAAVCARLGVPLVAEGRIAGSGSAAAGPARVVFVDVDGTLIDGPLHRDETSLAALRHLQDSGIHVVAVTGRDVDAFMSLELGIDLAVCSGKAVDVVSMTEMGAVLDKGAAVDAVCGWLGETACAAIGDGSIDAPMFAAVRARGGRCAWVASGQAEPARYATDLVGPVGSGGVGRFATDIVTGTLRPIVPAVSPVERKVTNYASRVVPRESFEQLAERFELRPSDEWVLAHGHVTTAYPGKGENPSDLPVPAPGARVEAYGLVRTEKCTALALTVDGETHQPNGTPFHLTVALAPTRDGHEKPVVAGSAVRDSLEQGTLERFDVPVPIATVAAPAGVETAAVPSNVVAAAALSPHDLGVFQRALNAGVDPAVLAAHAATSSPLAGTLEAGSPLRSGLVVLVGPPAAGKSTFAQRFAAETGAVTVSLDGLRGELNGDEGSQDRARDVVAAGHARRAAELALGRLVVFDATNVRASILREHAEAAHAVGLPAVAVPFIVDKQVALERDRARHEDGRRAVGVRDGQWSQEAASEVFGRMYENWFMSARELKDPAAFGLDAVVSPDVLAPPAR